MTIFEYLFKGGPGSGHHGHKGIPGQRGWSVPGGVGRRAPFGASEEDLLSSLGRLGSMASGPSDWKYNSQFSLVEKMGRFFEVPTSPRPEGVEKGPNKECYRNAVQLAMDNPDYTYVEGVASIDILPGHPISHAWVVNSSGMVIDPTWDEAGTAYLGIPFETSFVISTISNNGVYGMIPDFPRAAYNPMKDGFESGVIKRAVDIVKDKPKNHEKFTYIEDVADLNVHGGLNV